ncbi:uncharacterized protein LOC132904273 [Amyelois transitella]|uniref:uncharacterized protein LOC132904273 n=1 Tax=Amyelois transitella TaxID=680683 RepID=UPI00298FA422|nr:uncharacterized protein LOC132904273 [Amyelois transitella]
MTFAGPQLSAPAPSAAVGAHSTEQVMSTMMEMILQTQRMQEETNKTIIETLRSFPRADPTGDFRTSTPSTTSVQRSSTAPAVVAAPPGNFTKCTARFNGKSRDAEKLEAFLDAVEVYKECADVSDQHALRGLSMLLEDDAALFWRSVKDNVTTWAEAVARLRAMYGTQLPPYKIFREVFRTEQSESERADGFISRLRALIVKLPYKVPDAMQIDMVYGLLHRRIRKRLSRDTITSMNIFVEKVRATEDAIAETNKLSLISPSSTVKNVNKPANVKNLTTSSSPTTGSVVTNNSNLQSKRTRVRCAHCKVYGHTVENCRNLQGKGENIGKSDLHNSSTLRCYGCGQQGVIKSRCKTCSSSHTNAAGSQSADFNTLSCKLSSNNMSCNSNYRTCHRDSNEDIIFLNNHDIENIFSDNFDIQCVFDERSDIQDVVSENVTSVQEDKIRCSEHRTNNYFRDIQDVSNENSNFKNCITNDIINLQEHFIEYSEQNYCNYTRDSFSVHSGNIKKSDTCDKFTNIDATLLPTVSIDVSGREGVAIIDTGATHSIASTKLYSILVEQGVQFLDTERTIRLADGTHSQKRLLTADVNVTIGGRKIIVEDMLVLPGASTKTLLGRKFVKKANIILDIPHDVWYFRDKPEQTFDFVKSYFLTGRASVAEVNNLNGAFLLADEGNQLTSEERIRLSDFIKSKADQFKSEGPATDFATHRIKVNESQEPIASPPYRMSEIRKKALREELDKLLRADIIEECESAWASNVVLVPKKDGSFKFCVDYRKLNAVTEPDRYPLPRIEDVLHAAKSTKYMSTLDLRSGFFQVNLHPDDRDKSAFTTPLGTFRFKRMPMGLRNSGATFQRLMDRFKSNLPGVTLIAYLDDLLVLSEGSLEKHLADLQIVFDRLKMFNLLVNREKSRFARDSVKFLGHVIVPGGIHVDPDKTAAITNMNIPQNIKHLKCFLQTSSWFRRFIPDYANIAKPLTFLLKKGSAWRWETEQQAAFDHIKELLVSAPILRQADESKPFILRTDSSGYCLGAALMQGEGFEERPIEYASRLLTDAERNYTTTEREALAVVWAVGKFRGYIEGSEIIVKSDHQPLRWLMSLKSPSGRLARWALTLQEYNLKIEYTPGRANVIADTLSRPVCADNVQCDVCLATVDVPARKASDIRENQMKDPEIRKILEDMECEDPFKGRSWTDRGYITSDGILYRYGPEGDEGDEACLVVPSHERPKVLADFHDAPTAGHFGMERTLARLRTRFYWPNMRKYVADYIKKCISCQRYKADNRKPTGLLQTPAMSRRFEVLSVDLFGPLPVTAQRNRWILIVEDVCSRWVELFPLENATSLECAKILMNEIF